MYNFTKLLNSVYCRLVGFQVPVGDIETHTPHTASQMIDISEGRRFQKVLSGMKLVSSEK